MGMHSVLYRASVGAGLSNVSLPIIPGPADTVSGTQYFPPRPLQLIALVGWGVNMSDVRLQTPYLLDTAGVQGTPVNITAALASNFNMAWFRDYPVALRQQEALDIQASQVDAGAQNMNVVAMMWDGVNDTPQTGRRFRARFTSATALTAGAWTRVPLVSAQVLPPKRFGVIGIYPRSATGLVCRLDFPIVSRSGMNMRPGVPVLPNVSSRLPWPLPDPDCGILGEFDNLTVPGAEFFATAADATQAVDLDLIVLN